MMQKDLSHLRCVALEDSEKEHGFEEGCGDGTGTYCRGRCCFVVW
jgi:hypothetical protein